MNDQTVEELSSVDYEQGLPAFPQTSDSKNMNTHVDQSSIDQHGLQMRLRDE